MPRIVLDPGHGGTDRANIGASGTYVEADGNLQYCLYLRDFLVPDFEVILTRDRDATLGLTQRGRMTQGADMFISVHSDAYTKTSSGVTIFDSVDLKNEDIAKNVGNAVARAMGIPFRGAKERESLKYPGEDYYTVVDAAQDVGCPCVLLLERGFHSNPFEEKILLNPKVVQKSAEFTALEIRRYFSVMDNRLEDALKVLQAKGIINSPKYWIANAKTGGMIKGEYAAILIQNMAQKLGGR